MKEAHKMTLYFDALIVAAGSGKRMGKTQIPKQYLQLCDKPIICHSLEKFLTHPKCKSVTIVINENDKNIYNQLVKERYKSNKLRKEVIGGKERYISVFNGLINISKSKNSDIILIHDAARPFIKHSLIDKILKELCKNRAATLATKVNDTLNKSKNNQYGSNVARENIYSIQTPQAFFLNDIIKAHQLVKDKTSYTDDASLAQKYGINISLVPSSIENIKITNQHDMEFAKKIASNNKGNHMNYKTKTALGFDVHTFDNDTKSDYVTLCGIKIPHIKKLKGHSDADVSMHAITDALYGSISAGDIGTHFPPTNPEFKNMNSSVFLKHANNLLKNYGAIINHIDLTIICEEPKISPHTTKMREKISNLLEIDIENISIKATTTEKLGFTGRKEGIAAQAIATISIPV